MLTIVVILVIFLVLTIWMLGEFKRTRHKFFIFFIILLILFFVFSVGYVFNSKPVDYTTVSGLVSASKVYLNWLGGVFGNMKVITSDAVKMDWKKNSENTAENNSEEK